MTRIITSGPDQAYPQAQTAWQRERAGGRLQAMDEHGRPWTACRVIAEIATMILLFGGLAVLWCVL